MARELFNAVSVTVGLLVTATSCGGIGGVSLILKAPVTDQCEETGLKGCEEMSEGVLLVVEGDKPRGLKKIGKGAAKNAPAELKKFAQALKLLGSIPGVSQYMGPVLEVAAYLEESPGNGSIGDSAPKEGAAAVASSERSKATLSLPKYLTVRTADTDAYRRRTATVYPSNDERTGPCGKFSGSPLSSCARVAAGPAVITDLIPSSAECGMSAVARDSLDDREEPRWTIPLAGAIHGAQLFVAAGDSLFLNIDAASESCAVVWSAFVPYGAPLPEEARRK
jgi:hypothetical protein